MIPTLDVKRLKSAADAQGLTQSELAKRSGVSRAQLSRILSGTQARVRPGTLERLARALKADTGHLCVGGELNQYRELVAKEHGELDFRGIGMPRLQRQPIGDVFVDLDVREEVDAECLGECGHGRARLSEQPILATECILTRDRVVVLGHPGCGKTTVLRFLAHSCATDNRSDVEIPLYVRLPELLRAQELDGRADPVKLVAAWAARHGCPNVEEALRSALADERRRCLVLLDGLDEVGNEEQKNSLIAHVQEFIKRYRRNCFVVTSRIVGFESPPWRNHGFAVFRILPYSTERLETFARNWARILAPLENRSPDELLETLRTAIFSNPRVRNLASNPLILTILVLLNEARGGTLPRRRVDLYEKVVDVFLDTWESNKRATGGFDDTYSIDLDAREFRWLLSDLALAMQKADRTLGARWWLAERMQGYLQQRLGFALDEAKDACDRILRYLVERTGLVEERGLDLFGFSHRTLQEYFASLGAIDEADASRSRDVTHCLREYYFHPQWLEVIRLVAAQLTPPPAESLVSSILDDPDPVGRFLRRGQLLALRCLSDGTTVANRCLTAGIFESLVKLGESRWLGITLEAIDVLESFEGTRLERQAEETVEVILQTAERELPEEELDRLVRSVAGREVLERVEEQLPPSFADSEAAREVTVTRRGRTHHVFRFNCRLLLDDPETWYSSVGSLLADAGQSTEMKELLTIELGRRAATDRRAWTELRKTLRSHVDASVRAASAAALAAGANGEQETTRLLLEALDADPEERVRHSCASALADAAQGDPSVRDQLLQILSSDESAHVRCGAAQGLAKASSQPSVLEALQGVASGDTEWEKVAVSCARALQQQIGENSAISDLFHSWLDNSSPATLRQVAAEGLALAMADETLAWDRAVIRKVEQLLMNLEEPCPSALDSLQALAAAREIRRGLRLERVLRDSLEPVGDRIQLAFVFGSMARNRQTEDSDIDLLVIGDVSLKGLSGPLREAEGTLGRRINPVIYTREAFREKYQAGDPFLLDVYRREKIPVIGPPEDSAHGGLDDELRAMVAERVASTE